jgi:AraC-like DNA-binding protein
MGQLASVMNTDAVAPRERPGFWADWVDRLFHGLQSDLYGDTGFDGRMSTLHAGDVVLTRLEANRHRVVRSSSLVRQSELGYLKIVAPYVGCAGVEQKGREAWVTPDQWSIYDTTDSYAVANPVRVEHLIVMIPKDRLAERGLSLDALMARRLGGSGGVSRLALETMRSAYRELPGMSETAARGVGDAITQFVHLSMLDLAGIGTAVTQREALRERIKQHVTERLADPGLSGRHRAGAELQPAPAVQRLCRGARRRGRLHPAARLEACVRDLQQAGPHARPITDIALSWGFGNPSHFSRVFRDHTGKSPSEFRSSTGSDALMLRP